MQESATLFIDYESEDETISTVIQIAVDSISEDQSRAELIAAMVGLYARPLLCMTRKELVELQVAVTNKQH